MQSGKYVDSGNKFTFLNIIILLMTNDHINYRCRLQGHVTVGKYFLIDGVTTANLPFDVANVSAKIFFLPEMTRHASKQPCTEGLKL